MAPVVPWTTPSSCLYLLSARPIPIPVLRRPSTHKYTVNSTEQITAHTSTISMYFTKVLSICLTLLRGLEALMQYDYEHWIRRPWIFLSHTGRNATQATKWKIAPPIQPNVTISRGLTGLCPWGHQRAFTTDAFLVHCSGKPRDVPKIQRV